MLATTVILCYNAVMKFRFLLLDIDDTVLDFKSAELHALAKTHEDFAMPYNGSDLELYHNINLTLWNEFEKGKISVSEVLANRFELYFKARGIAADSLPFRLKYEENLSERGELCGDGVIETLEFIKTRARIFAVTNGVARIQASRLKETGINRYFEKIFISELIGCRKPEKGFFDYVEANIDGFDKDQALLVGDSLSADIPAAKYGFHTCWINRQNQSDKNADIKPEFTITKFTELKNFWRE